MGPLEKAMATHSSTPAWKVPWMEEPSGLQSMGSHRVGHDWSDLAAAAAYGPTSSMFMSFKLITRVTMFPRHKETVWELSKFLFDVVLYFDARLPKWGGGNSPQMSNLCKLYEWQSSLFWWKAIKWQLTSIFLPGKFHGERSLQTMVQSHKALDTTEHTHTHTHTHTH